MFFFPPVGLFESCTCRSKQFRGGCGIEGFLRVGCGRFSFMHRRIGVIMLGESRCQLLDPGMSIGFKVLPSSLESERNGRNGPAVSKAVCPKTLHGGSAGHWFKLKVVPWPWNPWVLDLLTAVWAYPALPRILHRHNRGTPPMCSRWSFEFKICIIRVPIGYTMCIVEVPGLRCLWVQA